MSSPLIFTPEYYERMRQLEDQSWWNAGMRDVASGLLGLCALPGTGIMLDVGCGSGQTLAWFERLYGGWRSIGFDVAEDGVRAGQHIRPGHVYLGSALAIPVASCSVNLVISLDVLQHLPLGGGDVTALAEIHRVLKPSGHVLLRTNAQSFPHTADDVAYNFHKYRPSEFRAKLEAAGLSVIRLSRINAVLGWAEIPRELTARKSQRSNYHGLLATPSGGVRRMAWCKRAWLRTEGRMVRAGYRLPLGRTLIALCRRG